MLQIVTELEHVKRHGGTVCPDCQTDLSEFAATGYEKRQVFDISPVQVEVAEHQVEIKQCPGCGKEAKGIFPATVTQSTQYGERLQAQASYLNGYHFIPLVRTAELLTDFYGQATSEAVSMAANPHHLRKLKFIHEQYQQPWAADMAELLLDIKAEVAVTPAYAMRLPADRLFHCGVKYDTIVAKGLTANPPPAVASQPKQDRPKQSSPKNLLDRLQTHKAGVLAFMADFRVPFDSNLAERDIRVIKVKQKVSGSFRTQEGTKTFAASVPTSQLPASKAIMSSQLFTVPLLAYPLHRSKSMAW